tara:strand:+ start:92 stop:598 length:507 start_codon:yes stop_codon:yes gene_type:complete
MRFRFKFDKHYEIKDKLLDLINHAPYTKIDSKDVISKTDYYINGLEKDYIDYIRPQIINFLYECFKNHKIAGYEVSNMWFQQYYKNDIHKWHTHKNTHFTCVYFVEMPDSDQKTLIRNFGSEDLIEYEAEEGDIIIFPAFLSHASPYLTSDNRKTIISFNLDIRSDEV